MHGFLSKALIVLALWSGTGLTATLAEVTEPAAQPGVACLGDTAGNCQSYADAMTAALAEG
ncbi:MAG TPA: hypothetical protein VN668_01855 [Stellaceae bacterium]|nr:hypothetical protein [Stellaceae bacterium]